MIALSADRRLVFTQMDIGCVVGDRRAQGHVVVRLRAVQSEFSNEGQEEREGVGVREQALLGIRYSGRWESL